MSDAPRTYSTLSAEEQSAVSVWVDTFEQSYEYEGASAFKKAVKAAPTELRTALISQLLPTLIDHERKQQGRTPTLHELRVRFPDLANELTTVYPQLPDGYRLPVELRGYRVLRVVGVGGQALVLRAQDDVHSAVAIKLSSSHENNEWLLRERELLGQCQHPGIPEVIASGVDQDRAFFVMPFLRGMTLADKYATHRPAAEEAARIAADLCGIVDHLHNRGILHRDIKPQNVWIDESGAVKLIDLGMAIDRSSWGSPRGAVDEFHGTPAFMSPEQAAADSENDGELSDVFSIGAVLYWMGTGATPYGSGSQESLLKRAAEGRIEQDRLQAISGWPRSLTRLCLEAIAADPVDRVSSAERFGERLRSLSAQSSPLGGPRPKSIALVLTLLMVVAVVVLAGPNLTLLWGDAELVRPDGISTLPAILSDERAEERWIDRIADRHRIDLASIPAESFKVGVNCRARLIEPWGEQQRGPSAYPELTLQLNQELEPLAPAIQYRVGESAWGELSPTEEAVTFTAPLSRVAAASHGPVQVRLVSNPSGQLETAVGPFQYDLDIARALKEDEQAFGHELFEEATTTKCFDVEQPGWMVREEYSRRIGPIVDEFWFGEQRDGPLTSVNAQLDKLAGAKKESEGGRPGFDLQQGFALASKEVQDATKLWVKIRFSGGGAWGPVLYEKPLSESQKEKQRVLAWFERLGTDDELARFRNTEFLLTRLNEITPSLTHLHFVGTRRFVNGDPTHVRDSESGDPKENKIEERPSSEVVFDLSKITGERTIELPLVWNPVSVKGRFPDGTYTPTFEVYNSDTTMCHCSITPFDASSREAGRELYVYIEDKTAPYVPQSILPLVPSRKQLSLKTIEGCKRTRLSLASPLPLGAASVEYFEDRSFSKRVDSAQPGTVYARYTDTEGKMVGYSAYKLSEEFIRVWVDHAIGHATPSSEIRTSKEPRPQRQ